MKRFSVFLILLAIICACSTNSSQNNNSNGDTAKEAQMRAMGLVDIHDLDSTIAVDLIYAKPYNFMGRVLYHNVNKAFMLPETAEKLVKANKLLKSIRPDLNLIVDSGQETVLRKMKPGQEDSCPGFCLTVFALPCWRRMKVTCAGRRRGCRWGWGIRWGRWPSR